jgi:hypothetical protein
VPRIDRVPLLPSADVAGLTLFSNTRTIRGYVEAERAKMKVVLTDDSNLRILPVDICDCLLWLLSNQNWWPDPSIIDGSWSAVIVLILRPEGILTLFPLIVFFSPLSLSSLAVAICLSISMSLSRIPQISGTGTCSLCTWPAER